MKNPHSNTSLATPRHGTMPLGISATTQAIATAPNDTFTCLKSATRGSNGSRMAKAPTLHLRPAWNYHLFCLLLVISPSHPCWLQPCPLLTTMIPFETCLQTSSTPSTTFDGSTTV